MAFQRAHRLGAEHRLQEAVLVFAHRQHPVIAKITGLAGAARRPVFQHAVDGAGFGVFGAHARHKGAGMADAAEHIIRQAQRTAAVGGQLRVEQFVQGGRFAIGKQGVAGDFL